MWKRQGKAQMEVLNILECELQNNGMPYKGMVYNDVVCGVRVNERGVM